MIPRLDEFNPVGKYPINDPMFLVNSPAPTTGEIMPQRLGLANSLEWIGENRRHQVKNPKRGFAVCLNPAPQIFSKVRGNDGDPTVLPGHVVSVFLFHANGPV